MPLLSRHHDCCRLITCFIVVFSFFVVELILGHYCHSLSLQTDAFLMLSRSAAMFLNILSVCMQSRPPGAWNTFGWQRASVVGPLINSIVLQTFCITILFHVLERLFEREDIHHPLSMLYVGVASLTVNILSLVILHGTNIKPQSLARDENHSAHENVNDPLLQSSSRETGRGNIVDCSLMPQEVTKTPSNVSEDEFHFKVVRRVNIVLEFMVPVILIICALINWLVPQPLVDHVGLVEHYHHGSIPYSWLYFIDPLLSLAQIGIISYLNIPTMIGLMKVLMQNVPQKISYPELNANLLQVNGVQQIHDLHVWLLKTDLVIGTVHVIAQITDDEMATCSQNLKNVFHTFGIHCTTIQLEKDVPSVSNEGTESSSIRCRHRCPGSECIVDECCNMGRTLKSSHETIHSHSPNGTEDNSASKSHHHAHSHSHHGHHHSHGV